MRPYTLELDFRDSPTLCEMLQDLESFVRIVVGPVGSGKSVACCYEIMAMAERQLPDPRDNIRRSRFAIIRNTSPELRSTTINTWLEHFPENACGPIVYRSPIEHRIRTPVGPGGEPGLDVEVLFIPLDKPLDVKKLRSLELTGAYVNEASEVPRAILMMLRRRVGRFPKKNRNPPKEWRERTGRKVYEPVHFGVIGDSNATDDDHWLAELAQDPPDGWAFYKQPMAVLEVKLPQKGAAEVEVVEKGPRLGERFPADAVINAAGRTWVVNPAAENLANLVPGYYAVQQLPGSKLAEIQRDVQAKWVYVQDGKSVIPSFNEEYFVFDDVPFLHNVDLQLGFDIGSGTLQPAAVWGQRHPSGIWLIHACLPGSDMGINRFVREVFAYHRSLFGNHRISHVWCDPAGENADELYEVAIIDHLKAKELPAQPAPSNKWKLRVEAWEGPLGRFIDGRPGIMIHSRCKPLIKALAGAWHYRRVQIAGEDRYQSEPVKNHPYSDLGDAGGYLLLGGGEHRAITTDVVTLEQQREWQKQNAPVQANTDFNPLALAA